MNDPQHFGFGQFVPGFDFLQNLAKGASQTIPQLPNLSNWIAPTLNVEELEKRISELKAVHFWLDQNSKALGATIQALEVQKMTLATLKGMNFNMGDVANALKLKTADTVMEGMQKVTESAASAVGTVAGAATAATRRKRGGEAAAQAGTADAQAAPHGLVDPLQWWGALTQQFQEIAGNALKDATHKSAVDTARHMATGMARDAAKAATAAARKTPRKTAARKTPRKPAGR